ncbi:MAG: hypothetical protein KAI83_10280 [Thiomargarita sp.]|nr:hypothetical protein [Thiomargarita sp.]
MHSQRRRWEQEKREKGNTEWSERLERPHSQRPRWEREIRCDAPASRYTFPRGWELEMTLQIIGNLL